MTANPESSPGETDACDEQGGEGPCLMARVCPECGRLADEDPPTRCENCQAEIDPS